MSEKSWRRIFYANVVLLLVLVAVKFRSEYKAVSSSTPTSWTEDHSGDCAVALTGGPGRVREGVDLLYRGLVKKLIVSGVHPQASWREIMPQLVFYSGINDEDVVLERRSTTTYGNANQTLPLVEALHCRNLILITSALHMHRAYQTFRNVFPPGFPLVVHSVATPGLNAWDIWLEALKSVFYSAWAY